jgi:hypothetical protein
VPGNFGDYDIEGSSYYAGIFEASNQTVSVSYYYNPPYVPAVYETAGGSGYGGITVPYSVYEEKEARLIAEGGKGKSSSHSAGPTYDINGLYYNNDGYWVNWGEVWGQAVPGLIMVGAITGAMEIAGGDGGEGEGGDPEQADYEYPQQLDNDEDRNHARLKENLKNSLNGIPGNYPTRSSEEEKSAGNYDPYDDS